jgi:hypothetical protein
MKFADIKNEGDMRTWVGAQLKLLKGISIEWVEPNTLHGSSIGLPDLNIKFESKKVSVELKYLFVTRKGIKWKVRPVQRRFHHITAKAGGRSALLCVISDAGNSLVVVRGDKVPLRDYASDKDSGCPNGKADIVVLEESSETTIMLDVCELLFNDDFWSREHWRNSYAH